MQVLLVAVIVVVVVLSLYWVFLGNKRVSKGTGVAHVDVSPPEIASIPKGVYVSPHADSLDKTVKWAVRDELGVLLSTHKTQAEAEKAGRALALANLSELVVVGKNGVVRKRNSYGT